MHWTVKAGTMSSGSVPEAREARGRNQNMIQLMGRLKEELGAVPVPTCNLGIHKPVKIRSHERLNQQI